jgi:hypothetical protein
MVRQFRTGVLIAAILVPLLPGIGAAETLDRVLAVVAGQVILLSDVTAARELGLQDADGAADPIRVVLNKLVDRQLVLTEVDRYAPPEPDARAIDRGVAGVRGRFASPQAFVTTLERSGIDENHVREIVRQDLRVVAYLNQRFATAGDRRTQLINDWMAGLRRRGDVIDMYITR